MRWPNETGDPGRQHGGRAAERNGPERTVELRLHPSQRDQGSDRYGIKQPLDPNVDPHDRLKPLEHLKAAAVRWGPGTGGEDRDLGRRATAQPGQHR